MFAGSLGQLPHRGFVRASVAGEDVEFEVTQVTPLGLFRWADRRRLNQHLSSLKTRCLDVANGRTNGVFKTDCFAMEIDAGHAV